MYQRGRDYPGLHVSRSLGDYTAHRIGATSEPGIGHEKIQKYNEYLVLASKGLWNVMTPKEVFEFIKVNSNSGLGTVSHLLSLKAKEIASSEENCPMQDITVII